MFLNLLQEEELLEEAAEGFNAGEVIIEHVANSGLDHPLIHLPHLGPIDMSVTKHVLMLWIVSALVFFMSDRGEPILARRPLGLGWTLAWTSDFKARWATDWLKWGTFGRFVSQLVRQHQKTDDTEIRPMEAEVVGDEVVATLDAYDEAENFENRLNSSLTVRLMGSEQETNHGEQDSVVPFRHVAPGLYQARAPLERFGAYAIKAVHKRVGSDGQRAPAGVSFASVTRPYPEEFQDLSPRPEALVRWAEAGGGAFSPEASQVFRPGQDRVKTKVGRQNDFILLALVLFLLDLLVRRVRIFDRDFKQA
jgi:hypothetical protein